jgi:myo-inositol-1(or 4)-monophosphatase
VVVDPIDGSINAKRGIPFFALSVAVADGPTMGDVRFGYVFDFGTREEWTATRGAGAQLNRAALPEVVAGDGIELLALEATTSELLLAHGPGLAAAVRRTRVLGSLALSLCHLAAGRLDAVCSLKGCRSVDIAAAQLLVSEVGLVADLPEASPLAAAPLDLERRSRIVAAATRAQYERLVSALDTEA